MEQTKSEPIKQFDLFEYARGNQGLIPVIVNSKMLGMIQYNPAVVSLRNRVNFISDSSALAKSLRNDKRVKNIVELFPSVVELYESQKPLQDLTNIYLTPKKVANDNDITLEKEEEKKKEDNVEQFPIIPISPKPVEVKPDNGVVQFPQNQPKEEIGYSLISPIRYTNQIRNQPFYVPSFNGGLVSRIQAANDNYRISPNYTSKRQGYISRDRYAA